jgi:uncharacterized membrane protein
MRMRPDALAAIAGMAIATYALRVGGLLLADKLPREGRWERALASLPGAVLVAIVVPNVIGFGPLGFVAAAAVTLVAVKVGNLIAAMAVGVLIIALGRMAGLA